MELRRGLGEDTVSMWRAGAKRQRQERVFSYGMIYLPQLCDDVDSIATLTTVTAVSVSGTLSVRDKSSGVKALVRINAVIVSRLRTHHTEIYLSVCWTSGGDLSSRPVQEFR